MSSGGIAVETSNDDYMVVVKVYRQGLLRPVDQMNVNSDEFSLSDADVWVEKTIAEDRGLMGEGEDGYVD